MDMKIFEICSRTSKSCQTTLGRWQYLWCCICSSVEVGSRGLLKKLLLSVNIHCLNLPAEGGPGPRSTAVTFTLDNWSLLTLAFIFIFIYLNGLFKTDLLGHGKVCDLSKKILIKAVCKCYVLVMNWVSRTGINTFYTCNQSWDWGDIC